MTTMYNHQVTTTIWVEVAYTNSRKKWYQYGQQTDTNLTTVMCAKNNELAVLIVLTAVLQQLPSSD